MALCFRTPTCILYSQHIPVRTSRCSRARQPRRRAPAVAQGAGFACVQGRAGDSHLESGSWSYKALSSKFSLDSMKFSMLIPLFKNILKEGPGWCGSVDEYGPVNQRVTGSIPCQGTYLGCEPGSHLGACKRQPIDVSLLSVFLSLSFFLPSPLPKNK